MLVKSPYGGCAALRSALKGNAPSADRLVIYWFVRSYNIAKAGTQKQTREGKPGRVADAR
jgi:hypothetical protein